MQRPAHGSKSAAIIISILLLLPVLYLLSTGPAVWLFVNGRIGPQFIYTVYWPLEWLVDRSDTCDRAMNWYLDFWDPGQVRYVLSR